jgi:hypothetical protein
MAFAAAELRDMDRVRVQYLSYDLVRVDYIASDMAGSTVAFNAEGAGSVVAGAAGRTVFHVFHGRFLVLAAFCYK